MKDFKKHIEEIIKYHRVGHGIALGVASCLMFILIVTIMIQCSNSNSNVQKDNSLTENLIKAQQKIPQSKVDISMVEGMRFDSASVTNTIKMLILKNDSLYAAVDYYQRMLTMVEKSLEESQGDIRQETNNIINKFNGAISLWLVILGLLCGFTPIVLACYNWKHDTEFLKQMATTLEKNSQEIDDKIRKMEEIKNDIEKLKESEPKRVDEEIKRATNKMNNDLKYFNTLQLYLHIMSVTKMSRFQSSPNREAMTESLLFSLVTDALSYLEHNEDDFAYDRQILQSFDALAEGLWYLLPFMNTNRKRKRCMSAAIDKLHEIQDKIYRGMTVQSEDLKVVCNSLREIQITIAAFK